MYIHRARTAFPVHAWTTYECQEQDRWSCRTPRAESLDLCRSSSAQYQHHAAPAAAAATWEANVQEPRLIVSGREEQHSLGLLHRQRKVRATGIRTWKTRTTSSCLMQNSGQVLTPSKEVALHLFRPHRLLLGWNVNLVHCRKSRCHELTGLVRPHRAVTISLPTLMRGRDRSKPEMRRSEHVYKMWCKF